MKVFISKGNSKLGTIPNVSLPPVITCEINPPCAEKCYAKKFYSGFAAHKVAPLWDANYAAYLYSPDEYFESIISQLSIMKNHRLFRWHVSGDIVDSRYLEGMIEVSNAIASMDFLAFTRRSWAFGRQSKNLNIVRSLWLTDPVADPYYPWLKVIPKGVTATCTGSCSSCGDCWHLEGGEGRTVNLH